MSANTVDAAISLLLALVNNAAQISALVGKAQAEGRTELTAEEWDDVLGRSDASQRRLQAAIDSLG